MAMADDLKAYHAALFHADSMTENHCGLPEKKSNDWNMALHEAGWPGCGD